MLKAIDSPFSKWSKTATFWLFSLLLTLVESRATFILWSQLGTLIAVIANSIVSEIYKNKACLLFLLLERENRVRISLVFRITGYSLVLQALNQFFFYYTYFFSLYAYYQHPVLSVCFWCDDPSIILDHPFLHYIPLLSLVLCFQGLIFRLHRQQTTEYIGLSTVIPEQVSEEKKGDYILSKMFRIVRTDSNGQQKRIFFLLFRQIKVDTQQQWNFLA